MNEDKVNILGLGYLGVGAPDLSAWLPFAEGILGMELVHQSDDELRFKMDLRVYRLAVHRSPEPLQYVGLEVQDERALELTTSELERAGTVVKVLGAQEASHRGVAGMVTCEDPSGTPLEFFYGAYAEEVKAFRSPTGARFVTGDQGMGHVVIALTNYPEAVEFLHPDLELLGQRCAHRRSLVGHVLGLQPPTPHLRTDARRRRELLPPCHGRSR